MVGGGINVLEDMKRMFCVGVDKVLLNIVVVFNLILIIEGFDFFGV